MANVLYRLGEVALDEGAFAEARDRFAESLSVAQEIGDRPRIAYVLEGFASLAVATGAYDRGRRLAGAAAQLRQLIGGPLPDSERARLRQRMAHCRTASLSSSRDRPLGLDEAITLALGTSSRAAAAPARPPTGRLTPREREVARLIALGKSNREIAECLTVAGGTAQRHVANILAKLDLSSRAQIASWTASRDLLGDQESGGG
jgi:DNA-binding CsgD family transcriptional regulator